MRRATPVRALLLALVLAAGLARPAAADQRLTPERQGEVEAVLRREGFTSWQAIELDDGLIEVDAAVDAAGKTVDLTLDPGSLAIVRRQAW